MKNKKLALALTIELWERLADTYECDERAKQTIYTNMREENAVISAYLPSHCFLCDAYYKENSYKNAGVYGRGCSTCPLFKSGNGCDLTDEDAMKDITTITLFNRWRNSKEREERHYAADVMLKTLKAL